MRGGRWQGPHPRATHTGHPPPGTAQHTGVCEEGSGCGRRGQAGGGPVCDGCLVTEGREREGVGVARRGKGVPAVSRCHGVVV